MKLLTLENTRPWLDQVVDKALRELEYERRKRAFRETRQRVRRLWRR